MSDNGLTTETMANVENISPAGAVPPPASAPADVELLDQPLPDQPIYDRGYVEQIRRDAAKYRTEAQRYGEVFGRYEPADQEVWFNLARTWEQDPARAAQIMQQIATGVLGETAVAEPQQTYDEPIETDEELTPAKVKELIEAGFQTREQAAAEQRAIDNVMSEVRDAGYDPNTAEGFMVLWNANNQTNGDIRAAADMVRGYRQTIIDEYVQGRSSGRVAMPSPSGVQGSPNPEPIKNLEDARRATDAFLRERRGA